MLAAFVLPTHEYAQAQSAAPQPSGAAKAALPPAHVTGRVLRKDATPLAKATVTLMPEGRSAEAQAVRVNSNGVFEFAEVPPGRYRFAAERNGYVQADLRAARRRTRCHLWHSAGPARDGD